MEQVVKMMHSCLSCKKLHYEGEYWDESVYVCELSPWSLFQKDLIVKSCKEWEPKH